jgi:hypothetical protein
LRLLVTSDLAGVRRKSKADLPTASFTSWEPFGWAFELRTFRRNPRVAQTSVIQMPEEKQVKSIARTLHISLCVATLSLFVLGRESVAQTNTFPPSGNAGVGTTSPWQKLTVIGTPGNREGVVIAGEGNPWVYTDLSLAPIATGIPAGKPINFNWSVRKDAYYGGDSSGPSLVMEIGRQGGGAYVPFIINPSGNLLLQSATNATNGNVGIGLTNPGAKLYVAGGGYGSIGGANQSAYAFGAQSIAADASIYSYGAICSGNNWGNCGASGGVVLGINNSSAAVNIPNSGNSFFNTGNVGIGTTTPSYRLDVQGGQINASGGLCIANDCKSSWSQVGGSTSQWTTAGSNIHYNAGNVGIGTGSPGARLHVSAGDYSFALFGPNTTWNGSLAVGAGNVFLTPIANRAQVLSSNGNLHLDAGSTQNVYISWLNNSNTIINGQGGSVGINTQTPNSAYKLDVNGEINATGIRVNGTPISGGGQWVGTGPIHYTGGNVGIGTTSPSTKLELASNSAIKLGSAYLSSGGDYVHLANNEWYNGTSWVANASGALIQISGQDVNFYRHDAAGSHTPSMNINSSGNVGIGTTNPPSEKLHVVGNGKFTGNLTVDGNINAKYQDVAEWVPSSEQLSAATVVILDTAKSNQVISSNQPYDTRVAGVISAQPGITLGEGGEGKVLVATTGRVRVKVDASRGAIQIGDLLVTSEMTGVAMKSEAVNLGGVQFHRPGTIIGKALEPLAKGQGEILVLLSLQ